MKRLSVTNIGTFPRIFFSLLMNALLLFSAIMFFFSFSFVASNASSIHGKDSGVTASIDKMQNAEVGKKAPWISGWTLKGEVFNIKKPFIKEDAERLALVFFATWCEPCGEGLERKLIPSAERLEKVGIKVVIIDVAEKEDVVRKYFNGKEMPFPVVLDPYGESRKSYVENQLPVTVLVDRDGIVQAILTTEGQDYIDRIIEGG